MKLVRFLLTIIAVGSVVPVINGEEGVSGRTRIELALRDYAKLMCSAVFISGRDLPEAERDTGPLSTENIGSSYSAFTEADRATTQVHIDRKRKSCYYNFSRLRTWRGTLLRQSRLCDTSSRRRGCVFHLQKSQHPVATCKYATLADGRHVSTAATARWHAV